MAQEQIDVSLKFAKVLQSQKGSKLVYDEANHIYRRDGGRKDKTKFYWRCTTPECLGRIHTPGESQNDEYSDEMYTILKTINSHTEFCDKKSTNSIIQLKKLNKDVKEMALSSQLAPSHILAQAQSNLDDQTFSQTQGDAAMARNIRRYRNKADAAPFNPLSKTGFEIPQKYKVIEIQEREENFLQYDSGSEDEDRIMIFGTNQGLQDISEWKTIGVDGTFDITPKCFEKGQLVTIHMIVQHVAIPRLYILLPNKKGETYKRLYQIIQNLNSNFSPNEVLMDYELANINALKEIFTNITIWGCLFHLCQNVYKKIVELGFKVQYSNDNAFRELIGCFPALSALPEEDIVEVFEALIDEDVDEKLPVEFVSYFENNYVGQKRRNRRVQAPFAMSFWNIKDRVLNNQPRTNNAIEGFHSNLSHHITNSHPSLWKMIDGLKVAEKKARKKLVEYDRGDDFAQKPCYRKLNIRLKNLVERYDSSQPIEQKIKFVKSVSHLINP